VTEGPPQKAGTTGRKRVHAAVQHARIWGRVAARLQGPKPCLLRGLVPELKVRFP